MTVEKKIMERNRKQQCVLCVLLWLFSSLQCTIGSNRGMHSFGIDHQTHHPIIQESSEDTKPEISMGTTLVAVKYRSGVIVAADSRTSVSGYVSNRFAQKITPITSHCVVLRSGSAADTQYLAKETRYKVMERQHILGIVPSISNIAHYLRFLVYSKNFESTSASYSASLLVAGFDSDSVRPRIYSVTTSGALLEEDSFAASGSGSAYVLGYLDETLREGKELDLEEAEAICRRAIELAIYRDGSSGGVVRLVVIDANGTREIQ